ncbi:hypothetical protein [Streptomyces sp. ME19-01-6]|uniref:hypothetical protein n=1 Tax=Streptomyces sp. ME19-01-6 TaxID=3028686 RepID=UPI0029A00093|nr:hypothetical protein [Streptomyces sp. ME19-01-6]MDX3232555.1 hypothetical protein [Streptomyces sp. ME19-01-6]
MQQNPEPADMPKNAANPAVRAIRWAVRRRRTAARLMLHGACYGTGTAAVSIVAVWLRHLL